MNISVYTVSQVNSYIKNMFTQDFLLNSVSVQGEVSNLNFHRTGHIYFTLKDEKAAITCVMFAGSRAGLKAEIVNGSLVVVSGSVDVFERDGKYQLYARTITGAGRGELYEKFLELKDDLAARGMFASEYKRPLPNFIRTLGVVTSPTGAAVRDIISVAKRRNPFIAIVIYPATVQGEGASASIVKGIEALNKENVDVMIVGRGGGSFEDLWPFNEECVAQAVFDSRVPVISAVGHETDTMIIDFVADLRAPTPSAAAELAVYDYYELENRISSSERRLRELMANRVEAIKFRLLSYRERLDLLSPKAMIRERRSILMNFEERLEAAFGARLKDVHHRLAISREKLNALSPMAKMRGGFAYIGDSEGKPLTDVNDIVAGSRLKITLRNGTVKATADEVSPYET